MSIFTRKKPKKQKSEMQEMPYIMISDYDSELISNLKQFFIQAPAPWRYNNDENFLTYMTQDSVLANYLDLRTSLSMPDELVYKWLPNSRIEESKQAEVEKVLSIIFSEKTFNLQAFIKIVQRAIYTGLEGCNSHWEDTDGVAVCSGFTHIDNRRHLYFRTDTTGAPLEQATGQADEINYELFLKDPQNFKATKIYTRENGKKVKVNKNYHVIIFNPWEWTFGWGDGICAGCYSDVRIRAFLRNITQFSLEKFLLPFVIVSADKEGSLMGAGSNSVAGSKTFEQIKSVAKKINISKAATIIAIPFAVKTDLLDIGGNKLQQLVEYDKFYSELIGNRILGSAAMVMSDTKTYGATKQQAMVSHLFIKQDRKFQNWIFNQFLLKRAYELNREIFNSIGVTYNDFPVVDTISEEINVMDLVEKIRLARELGLNVQHDSVAKKLGIKLDKSQPAMPMNPEGGGAVPPEMAAMMGGGQMPGMQSDDAREYKQGTFSGSEVRQPNKRKIESPIEINTKIAERKQDPDIANPETVAPMRREPLPTKPTLIPKALQQTDQPVSKIQPGFEEKLKNDEKQENEVKKVFDKFSTEDAAAFTNIVMQLVSKGVKDPEKIISVAETLHKKITDKERQEIIKNLSDLLKIEDK